MISLDRDLYICISSVIFVITLSTMINTWKFTLPMPMPVTCHIKMLVIVIQNSFFIDKLGLEIRMHSFVFVIVTFEINDKRTREPRISKTKNILDRHWTIIKIHEISFYILSFKNNCELQTARLIFLVAYMS